MTDMSRRVEALIGQFEKRAIEAEAASLSHKARADGLEERVKELEAALRRQAVKEDFDYPTEVPVSCGFYCDLCEEETDAAGIYGHGSDCLLHSARALLEVSPK